MGYWALHTGVIALTGIVDASCQACARCKGLLQVIPFDVPHSFQARDDPDNPARGASLQQIHQQMGQEEWAVVVCGQCDLKAICCLPVLRHEHPSIVDEAVKFVVVSKETISKLLNRPALHRREAGI